MGNEAEKTPAANEAEKTQKVPETNAKSNKRDQEDRLEGCTDKQSVDPARVNQEYHQLPLISLTLSTFTSFSTKMICPALQAICSRWSAE